MLETSCRCSPRGLQQPAQIYCSSLAASTALQLCSRPGGGWVAAPSAPSAAATGDGASPSRAPAGPCCACALRQLCPHAGSVTPAAAAGSMEHKRLSVHSPLHACAGGQRFSLLFLGDPKVRSWQRERARHLQGHVWHLAGGLLPRGVSVCPHQRAQMSPTSLSHLGIPAGLRAQQSTGGSQLKSQTEPSKHAPEQPLPAADHPPAAPWHCPACSAHAASLAPSRWHSPAGKHLPQISRELGDSGSPWHGIA